MKAFRLVVVALAVIAMTATVASAGGDKNHGSKGKGKVVQNQVRK